MEISPIAGVCGASLLKPLKEQGYMPSVPAVDDSARTGDDTYEANGKGADRGPEEEKSGESSDSEVSAGEGTELMPAHGDSVVNVFA
jgi:hypothetical protein